jgi:RNA polymerase sigma-70 factor (ECF subfamily)
MGNGDAELSRSTRLEEITRTHAGRLHAAAQRILGEHAQHADDVVQTAFLSAFKSLDGFREEANLGTWMHRIVINAALKERQRRARQRSVEGPLIEDLVPAFDSTGHFQRPQRRWGRSPEDLASDAEQRRLIRRKINELPEDYRNVLLLRDLEGLTTQEAAEQLEISVSNAKVRLHRARLALRGLLDRTLGAGASL